MKAVHFFKIFSSLCRLQIAFFTAYSAIVGYILGPYTGLMRGTLIMFGVFLLASGASCLNQYQEQKIDAMMERTRRRPLPSGVITPSSALLFSVALIIGGLIVLGRSPNSTPLCLGILALLWYNGLYTGLKKITAFAAIPGAVVGMIPPAIGWASAGGSLSDTRLFAVCFFFFMWQVPHFWLQVLHHGRDYEQARLPSLTSLLSKKQIARMTFVWICSAAISGLLLPLYGVITLPLLYLLLFMSALWIIIKNVSLTIRPPQPDLSLSAFRLLNGYILIVMSLVPMEKLFLHSV